MPQPPLKPPQDHNPPAITTLEQLAATLAPGRRLLGLDLGQKTIGLALSDTEYQIASPLETLRRRKFTEDIGLLKQHIFEHQVAALILGLPINMDGSEGPRAQSTRAFARNLTQHIDLPILFWDERLSTQAAERAMLQADMSRKRRGEIIDQMAATYILQGALDRLNHLRRQA